MHDGLLRRMERTDEEQWRLVITFNYNHLGSLRQNLQRSETSSTWVPASSFIPDDALRIHYTPTREFKGAGENRKKERSSKSRHQEKT
jgi:hypothetical protein